MLQFGMLASHCDARISELDSFADRLMQEHTMVLSAEMLAKEGPPPLMRHIAESK